MILVMSFSPPESHLIIFYNILNTIPFNNIYNAESLAKYPHSSLADLYDPLTMPKELAKAHKELDLAVDKLYQKTPFKDDAERVSFLFEMYKEITSNLGTSKNINF